MIANVVHLNLNARGGSERLSVATIHALQTLGLDVELSSLEKPNGDLSDFSYGGASLNYSSIKKFRTVNLLTSLEEILRGRADITVNTHGDVLAFYRKDFSKMNSIVYCHYPIAGYAIEFGHMEYENLIRQSILASLSEGAFERYAKMVRQSFRSMLINSTVLTNSNFSRTSLLNEFGVESAVIPPPVDVEKFQSIMYKTDEKQDDILVISRFHPSKRIENAIQISHLLKKARVGRKVRILGNISTDSCAYYESLTEMSRKLEVDDYVEFETNTTSERLLQVMKLSKVYLHPLPGEPFGISTVEAMSAGLVPVVPFIGGHAEFVPARYHFHTLGEAVEGVAHALTSSFVERKRISESARKYSVANYVQNFQKMVCEHLTVAPIC